MEATVRRTEFVVFDRCGADEDGEKGKDLTVCDDGEPEPRLVLKEKHGAFGDSLSDCNGAHADIDFVEELPWLRYHGYEYDDSLDDEILEEQVVGAEFSVEQEEGQGTSGRSFDEYKKGAAEEQEEKESDEENPANLVRDQEILADQDEQGTSARSSDGYNEGAAKGQEEDDEENTSNLVHDEEILADQGVAACRVEACEELDGRDDDNILEASVEQGTTEEKLSDDIYKSQIPDQEVIARAGAILEDSFKEDVSSDQEANDDNEDECHVESDGESDVPGEHDLEDQQSMPDDDNVFEQYDNSVDDEPEQDSSLANAQNELGNPTSKNEDAFEETTIVQQIDQDNNADTQKELEIMTSVLEESGMCSAGGCRPGMCSCLWASSGRSYSMANTKECLI
ncbi:hypothetical protein SORBI_3010G170550 [Sorghum bicolor]|uniref:Uncharacterized protein n=1 Tax=Sorghum bicolor TaxID=4558 RepID=A0A1W0VTK2_SORBI|nr:hypothetical protein SORBI_3010G170550 [Sorghum bicolor]